MKRIAMIILVIALLMSAFGCAATTSMGTTTTMEETTKPTTAATTTEKTTARTTTTRPPTQATTKATTSPQIGSRLNPAPLEYPLSITLSSRLFDAQIAVAITEVIRGEEAKKMVMKENRFNDIPDGKEVVLAWVEFKLLNYAPIDENDEFSISEFDFEFYTGKYESIELESVVVPDPLEADLFEGASTSGYIYALVDLDEEVYVRYEDIAWFSLRSIR